MEHPFNIKSLMALLDKAIKLCSNELARTEDGVKLKYLIDTMVQVGTSDGEFSNLLAGVDEPLIRDADIYVKLKKIERGVSYYYQFIANGSTDILIPVKYKERNGYVVDGEYKKWVIKFEDGVEKIIDVSTDEDLEQLESTTIEDCLISHGVLTSEDINMMQKEVSFYKNKDLQRVVHDDSGNMDESENSKSHKNHCNDKGNNGKWASCLEFINDFGCFFLIIGAIVCVVAFLFVDRCSEKRRIELVADSIKKAKERERFIQDSIKNTPEYKDSVRREHEEFERKWNECDSITLSNTLVITCDDSIYHYSSKCDSILKTDYGNYKNYPCPDITKDKEKYRLITKDKAIAMGYRLCDECERVEDVYREYEDGYFIHHDDIIEYVKDNWYEFKDLCE